MGLWTPESTAECKPASAAGPSLTRPIHDSSTATSHVFRSQIFPQTLQPLQFPPNQPSRPAGKPPSRKPRNRARLPKPPKSPSKHAPYQGTASAVPPNPNRINGL
jgi:hypothetical protein